MSGIFLILFTVVGATNYEIFMDLQVNFAIFLFLPLVAIICFIATLMETNRPPFDLSEAESDVVAGYTIEYTGIMFGLFYLGEYVSLFTNAFVLVIIFSGGWWNIINYAYICFDLIIFMFSTYKLNYNLNISSDIDIN
jgi:NADH:ubiquinone oxidoreductase subunit H